MKNGNDMEMDDRAAADGSQVPGRREKDLKAEEIRVSVRNMVEFLLRSGDIDNRRKGSVEGAMQEGGRIHRMIQRRMGPEYRAEVSLRFTHLTDRYALTVEGRADGVIDSVSPQSGKREVVIDEIKGTYRELGRMKAPVEVHLAQAKCYAYIYGVQTEARNIRVRMTYCNMETEDIRYFYSDYLLEELEEWFHSLLREYGRWADYEWEWKRVRLESIGRLEFPFAYREGQRELAAYVYQTIYHKKKLFLEAPTGVGKTLSTVFPAVKAVGKGLAGKIFYLTAKTITRTVAENSFELLRAKGLRFKSVILTAKDKICFQGRADCNPEYCSFAKGHYDRVNEAIYDFLIHEESFSRKTVEEYAVKHHVCPFELCLDMSLFSDGVICDYNYLFDPHVYMKRFFGDGGSSDYVFLVDEAHNLLERGREMYSASLRKEEFLQLKKELREQTVLDSAEDKAAERSVLVCQGYASRMEKLLEKCNRRLLELKRECEDCRVAESIDPFLQALQRLYTAMDEYLDEQEERLLPVRDSILDFYFKVCHFLDIYERVDENYVKYTKLWEDGSFLLKLFCVNPAKNLQECMQRGRSSILFSATLLPIQYYKRLLGGDRQDFEVYARSVFNPEKRALLIANDVTSKFTRRSEAEYGRIARYIHEIVKNRGGNYMVFCPSYSFLREIYERYEEAYGESETECILQQEFMKERDREEFLRRFEGNEDCDLEQTVAMDIDWEEERTLIGFCVLGGVFGEGIDLKNDRLIGVIIVGTGFPQVCSERELLRRYFDEGGEDGFDYSYRYPGINKVLQAAGRVIRTAEDVGIIALLDERFLQLSYRRLFPREWENFQIVSCDTVAKRVERFWDSWL